MRKILLLICCSLFLTSCSMFPDIACAFCDKYIYSESAKTIDDSWCCDECYSNASLCEFCDNKFFSSITKSINENICCDACYSDAYVCEYCNEKYIYQSHGDKSEFCDSCIESGDVLYCYNCDNYKSNNLVAIEPQINDGYLVDSVCYDCLYDVVIPYYCGTDFEDTWGALVKSNGGKPVYSTLTEEQRALVKYPYLNYDAVCFVPKGTSFHSVDWCYTLERSNTVYWCSYDEATKANLTPCSKCVWFQ